MLTKVVIKIKQTFSYFVLKLVLLNQESWEPWGPCGLNSWRRSQPAGT